MRIYESDRNCPAPCEVDSRFPPVVVLRICSSLCDINCNRQSIFLHWSQDSYGNFEEELSDPFGFGSKLASSVMWVVYWRSSHSGHIFGKSQQPGTPSHGHQDPMVSFTFQKVRSNRVGESNLTSTHGCVSYQNTMSDAKRRDQAKTMLISGFVPVSDDLPCSQLAILLSSLSSPQFAVPYFLGRQIWNHTSGNTFFS
jgi:hypothetical protein